MSWESGAVIDLDLLSRLDPRPHDGQKNWYRHYNEMKNEDALKRYVAQTYRTYDVLEGQLKKSSGTRML